MNYLVGIDLGSTSLKAVVYDVDGNAVASASRPTERYHPEPQHPEWTVWKPEQIWGDTAAALKEAVGQLDDAGGIKGVAVTGMGMDGLPIDEDGQWLYPFISWLDPRTEPQQRWWLEKIGAERQFSLTGNQLWPVTAALRIRWMMEHEPEVMARASKWLLIEDFLNFMLCGRCATDYSMASNMLLLDQRRLTWSDELLGLSGIDRDLLCEPLPSGTVLGEVSEAAATATGLPQGTPVVLGGHDYLCGALPVGAFRPGVVLDVTGTWEIVVAALPQPVLTREVLEMGIIVESHVARGTYAAMCASVAADMIEWFRKEYASTQAPQGGAPACDDWESFIQAARESPPGANGVLFLPHMSGSTCPIVDPRSMGAFVGLRSFTTRADTMRAVLEGLGYQFLEILRGLDAGLDTATERVVAIGGAIKNELWMQIKADVVGKPIEVPDIEDATPLGAAILAGIGVGVYENEEDACARVYRPGRVYEPDPQLVPRYAEGFELYRQVYPALREVHWGLFDQGGG